MPNINIQLPVVEADQMIEVEVKINGQKKKINYRIEIFSWTKCLNFENKAECLKTMIQNYDQQWQVIQIGGHTDEYVPLMFKQIIN